jgi:hypothetical protein
MFHDPARNFLLTIRITTTRTPTKCLETTTFGCYNPLDYLALALRFIVVYAAPSWSNR